MLRQKQSVLHSKITRFGMLTEGICSTLKFSTNRVWRKWLMHSSSCTACNSIDTMPLINHKKHHLQNHPAGNIWSCRTIPQISYCAHLPTAISLPSGAGIGSGVQDRKESGKVMGTCNLMSQLSTFYNVFYSFLIYRIPSEYINASNKPTLLYFWFFLHSPQDFYEACMPGGFA